MTKLAQHSRKDDDSNAEVKSANVVPIRADADVDPLANFKVEAEGPTARAARAGRLSKKVLGLIAAIVVAAALSAAAGIVYARQRTSPPSSAAKASPLEHASLNSRPEGAAVIVDGVARGVTPIDLTLPVGQHEVLLRNEAGERQLSVTVEKGTRISENVDMPAPAASGQLDVTSEPLGARVLVDGTVAGRTPMKVRSLTPGRHVVVVSDGTSSVNRTVDLTAGATISMFLSLATPAGGPTGTLAIDSPVELRLLEDGHLLGLSNGSPLVLPPGKHRIDLVNDALEMKASRMVTVEAGKAVHVSVPPPNGTLFVNATPWADVSVDGRTVGTTPLGDVSVAVGSHEIVWRHPQFGERRKTVVVGAQTPVRLTMDMSR